MGCGMSLRQSSANKSATRGQVREHELVPVIAPVLAVGASLDSLSAEETGLVSLRSAAKAANRQVGFLEPIGEHRCPQLSYGEEQEARQQGLASSLQEKFRGAGLGIALGLVCSAVAAQGAPDPSLTARRVPTIMVQPVSAQVEPGGKVVFKVEAAGAKTYEWHKDARGVDAAVEDGSGPMLVIENAQEAHVGAYYCVLGNEFGTVSSERAWLQVSTATKKAQLDGQQAPALLNDVERQRLATFRIPDLGVTNSGEPVRSPPQKSARNSRQDLRRPSRSSPTKTSTPGEPRTPYGKLSSRSLLWRIGALLSICPTITNPRPT